MKTKTAEEIRAKRKLTPERRAAISAGADELLAEVELHAIREQRGVTQQALAEALSVSRPRVSEIERSGEDLRLSTVQRYVEALGGHLTITATFDDGQEVQLRPRAA